MMGRGIGLLLMIAVATQLWSQDETVTGSLFVTGNLGVGTPQPGTRIDVVGGAIRSNAGIISRSNTESGLFVGYGAGLDGSMLQMFALYADATNGLYFDAPKDAAGNRLDVQFNWRGGGVPAFFIKGSSSNIGIGTASPAHKLDVRGDIGLLQSNKLILNNTAGGNNWIEAQASPGATMFFTASVERMRIDSQGNVGIGTSSPGHKLAVNGSGKFKELIVETTGWSDYVFAPDYVLQSLSDVEAHIKEHQHLPGIPSAEEVAERGVSVGEMQAKLLAKIEEMTLHMIELQKQVSAQSARIQQLEAENASHPRAH